MDAPADLGPRAQPREGPDDGALGDARALDMAVRPDFDLVRDSDPGAEEDIGADDDIAADLGVETEIDRRRIDQGRAAGHGGAAQPGLQDRLGGGEIGP